MRRSDPKHLAGILSDLLKSPELRRDLPLEEVIDSWREVVGPEVARRTVVKGLRKGRLQVEVASAALLFELAGFQKEQLLAGMQERLGAGRVREIRFRHVDQPPVGEEPDDVRGGDGEEPDGT